MTAREFAHLVNTPYPTVAQWLRDGRVPRAELQEIGNLKVWLIPRDVLKDFKRPEMGRPARTDEEKARTDEEKARTAKRKVIEKSAADPPFEPAATTKPKAGAKKAPKNLTKRAAKKLSKQGNQ